MLKIVQQDYLQMGDMIHCRTSTLAMFSKRKFTAKKHKDNYLQVFITT